MEDFLTSAQKNDQVSPDMKTAFLCADTPFGRPQGTAGALCSESRLKAGIAPLILHKFLF